MEIETIGIPELKKKLKEIEQVGDKQIMESVGLDAIKLMESRTLSGRDVIHAAFDGYSKSYKKESGKADPPNLKVTGKMLGAMKARVIDPLTVVIRVVGDKAYNLGVFHQVGNKNLPSRKWFGIETTEDRTKILDRLKKLLLAKIIKDWNK